ncbi:MAG: RNase P modulator RnpM [Armatimonadota bacterium]
MITKLRKTPIRTCVACRTSGEKRSLVRIVRCSTGEIMVDNTGKLAGRGAYLCRSAECLRRAIKEKRLPRALRTEVPEEAVRQLEQSIEQGSEDM